MPLARLGSAHAGYFLIHSSHNQTTVIPAEAGTHSHAKKTLEGEAPPLVPSSSRVVLNSRWVPAFAGMTVGEGEKIISTRIFCSPAETSQTKNPRRLHATGPENH
jgi:hypothetical protein